MNKEEGIKLNNAFDEFCQNFNIKSALAYLLLPMVKALRWPFIT